MTYPNTIDTFRRVTADPKCKLLISDQNNMADTVEGIENELGMLPKGSHVDVKTRLDYIEPLAEDSGNKVDKSGDTMSGDLIIDADEEVNNLKVKSIEDRDSDSENFVIAGSGGVVLKSRDTNTTNIYFNTASLGYFARFSKDVIEIRALSDGNKKVINWNSTLGFYTEYKFSVKNSQPTDLQGSLDVTGVANLKGEIQSNGIPGVSGSFTTNDGKTVTVTNGLITSIV